MRRSRWLSATPVIARYRLRCPARIRIGTTRWVSTATTPGRRVSSYFAAALRGSTKLTVTSWRSASQNCVWIRCSIASVNTKPTINTDTANAIPKIDAAARIGWRLTLRSTIRPALPR